MRLTEAVQRLRYNLVPDHLVGELLTKRWADNLVPFLFVGAVVAIFGTAIDGFFTPASLIDTLRQLGEFLVVVVGLTVVMLGGGIDLSVGSIYALAVFSAIWVIYVGEGPAWLAFAAAVATGAAFGALNGFLVGYLRLRAFLTTLVTLIIGRSLYDILIIAWGKAFQRSTVMNDNFDWIGTGAFHGVPVSVIAATLFAVLAHVALSRSRAGWHVAAVGGSRRAAYNAGIAVRRTVFLTYVFSGFACGVAGFLFAARLSGTGPGTGAGLELMAVTAAVVGGVALGGGRGSVAKGLMGAVVVLILVNGLIRLGFGTGYNQMVLGALLAVAVLLDIRWLRNRHKVLAEVYVSPVFHLMGETPPATPGSSSPYALDNRLSAAAPIALGEVEGPEDVILDRDDNLYAGTRHGEIVRWLAPDYSRQEVFAHIGGFPLGLALDRDGSIVTCVGAMGLYSIAPDRTVRALSTETRRSLTSVTDDARLRDPNDCDIGPDGRVWFTDSTTRYDAHDWALDSIESRPTGRLLVYDPKTGRTRTVLEGLRYANGVCLAHDAKSIFIAESWACRIHRYWLEGPKAGRLECVIRDMPGYPDNINRASDGRYWMAWLGMRTPSFDLALRYPAFRKRMTRRLPKDEWLFPNINTGGVVKFDETGAIADTLGDLTGESHPMVTSMREHKGWLYIGGILNNRIGRYRIPGADPDWTGWNSYWGGTR
ncbi:ribose transport system permease protein [Pseudoxanthobacter soli DSM 19599]|uniref:Ribose transport system permease protein n=1 Tax=Pseudoxanthobacter soli DSM 19599 TaxID=1123029 RepID=A0A1M7ZRT8_9HYPH|nr:SMP-30/gluconolactonase/LRE family protein [Pseudoxanthobacter soli]SHO67623.1 ribose transport system permease protein [Pseudoxanthobacter soli DSM 19599]